MKLMIFILTAMLLGQSALADMVFRCANSIESLTIDRDTDGKYQGYLKLVALTPHRSRVMTMSCVRSTPVPYYKCTNGNYIATARRGTDGKLLVDLELKGDFWPDSGYLHSIDCQQSKNLRIAFVPTNNL